MPTKKLFLLDAYALIYRAYFALINNPTFNSKGLNTSAILGFTIQNAGYVDTSWWHMSDGSGLRLDANSNILII
jgi:hypothetical protein